MVTHDRAEAEERADRVIALRDGRLADAGASPLGNANAPLLADGCGSVCAGPAACTPPTSRLLPEAP